jgi:hypothetical protein
MLPKPKGQYGYTQDELKQICKDRGISFKKFNSIFGVNTVAVDKSGKINYYVCDVERTLYELGNKDGCFHCWD